MTPEAARIVLPTPYPVGPVNCWLLRGEPLTLIDSGPNTPDALTELEAQLASLDVRLEDIELLVLSHQHADHVGLAATVQERSGCGVAGHELLAAYLRDYDSAYAAEAQYDEELMRLHGVVEENLEAFLDVFRGRSAYGSSVVVDRPLREGDVLTAGGRRLTVSLRPGHSPSDTIFVDADTGDAFVADHLLAHISSNALAHRPLSGSADPRHRTSALVSYLGSLERTARDDLGLLHTGHGEQIASHRPLIAERRQLLRDRAESVFARLTDEPCRAGELSASLWPEIPPSQTYLALSEALGALDVLEREGRVLATEDESGILYERRPGGTKRTPIGPPPAADPRAAQRADQARTLAAGGDVERAVDEAWRAAATAAAKDDETTLERLRELAAELSRSDQDDVRSQAEQLAEYCTHCLVSIRAGDRRGSLFHRLFNPWSKRSTKTCPDCAETVKAAARVCRFCGYRFDA